MPDNSANVGAMDASGHSISIWLAFLTGNEVLSGTITAVSAYPVTSITYTLDNGDSADVQRGYRVAFYNSSGGYKGASIVRAYGTLSNAALPIRETSQGVVNIVVGDTFKVFSVIHPGDKLTEADARFRPDGLPYVDQSGEDTPPIVCSGGHFAAFVDSGETYATVAFKGDESYTVAADSDGTITHSWSAPTATGTTSSTSANPSFTFPVGQHTVLHTVTDSTNAQTWTQVVNGAVFSNAQAPYSMTEEDFSLEGDSENGWLFSFGVRDVLSLAEVPDGAMVIVFCRERINRTVQSFRNMWSGRRSILFTGYLQNDTTGMSGEDGVQEMTMTAYSPLAYYKHVLGYSKVGTNNANPTSWSDIADLTVSRMGLHIVRWYSWLTESWDFVINDNFSDAEYPQFFITKQATIAQVNELLDARNARLYCDRTGRFEIATQLNLLPMDDRDDQTTTLTLNNGRMADYEMSRSHERPLEFYHTRGIVKGYSGNTPVFAKWPGFAPGYGVDNQTTERLIPDSVAQHFEWCGLRGAAYNRDFQTADDTLLHAPELVVTLPGSYDVFDPAYPEWVEFESGSCPNLRDVDVSAFRWIVRRVSWENLQDGTFRVELRLTAETFGMGAVDDTPPPDTSTGADPGNWTPPGLEFPPFTVTLPPTVVPTHGLTPGLTRLARILSNGHIRRTTNFERSSILGGPSWDDNDLSGTVGTSVQQWCYDARSNSANTAGWIVTATAIYHADAVWGTPTATLQKTFGASSLYHDIDADYIFEVGLFVIVSMRYSDGVYVTVSRDGGSTWSTETRVGTNTTPVQGRVPPVRISTVVPGRAWLGSWQNSSSNDERVYRTDDYGATWTDLSNIFDDEGYAAGMVLPPLDESVMYYGYSTGTTNNGVYRGNLPNVSKTDITPTVSTVRYGVDKLRGRFTLSVSPNSKDRLLVCGADDNEIPTNRGVFLVTNASSAASAAATTFNTLVSPGSSVPYVRGALVDNTTAYLFGLNGAIAYSADAATVDSRIGNSVDTAEVVGITG